MVDCFYYYENNFHASGLGMSANYTLLTLNLGVL